MSSLKFSSTLRIGLPLYTPQISLANALLDGNHCSNLNFSEIFNITLYSGILNRLPVMFYFVTVIAFVNFYDSYLIMISYIL